MARKMKQFKATCCRILYEIFARYLPENFFPGGHLYSKIRYLLIRNFLTSVGKNIDIDRNVHLGNEVVIGDWTGIGPNCRIYGGTIIGKHTSISQDISIITSNHIYAPNTHAYGKRFAKINIGDYVWIGAKSIILSGVTIGDNVVIGAGSVVTKSIESNSIVAGNPAKKIKEFPTSNPSMNHLITKPEARKK